MTAAPGAALALLAAALLALPAACGKKPSQLKHPEGVEATYPRTYPPVR